MTKESGNTAQRLLEAARLLIVMRGYNGFSYADLAGIIGIRKASIHFHFPAKADLVVAVVEQARGFFRGQIAAMGSGTPDAEALLQGYVEHWRRCIDDNNEPFCLAAILAAELPSLPDPVADAVRGHFDDLTEWLSLVLARGQEQGVFALDRPARTTADAFLAAIYGAMLSARAFGDAAKFSAIADAAMARIVRS